jgi:hypothetical protein
MKQNKILGVWRSMHNRCSLPNQASFKNYGGRGICVDPRWHGAEGFQNFLRDMGPPPEGGTLERVNNDGPYSPENCRWATREEQARNKRNNRMITANGQTLAMAQWAKLLGCSPSAILNRIKNGMTEKEAVTMPIPERPNSKLNTESVRFIRSSYPVKTLQMLANELKVSKKTVMNVVHGRIFKDVV